MKIFAHHEMDGTIRSFVTFDGPEGMGMMLAAKPGIAVSELDLATFKSGSPSANELREFAKTHRVSGAAKKHFLEKKV